MLDYYQWRCLAGVKRFLVMGRFLATRPLDLRMLLVAPNRHQGLRCSQRRTEAAAVAGFLPEFACVTRL